MDAMGGGKTAKLMSGSALYSGRDRAMVSRQFFASTRVLVKYLRAVEPYRSSVASDLQPQPCSGGRKLSTCSFSKAANADGVSPWKNLRMLRTSYPVLSLLCVAVRKCSCWRGQRPRRMIRRARVGSTWNKRR